MLRETSTASTSSRSTVLGGARRHRNQDGGRDERRQEVLIVRMITRLTRLPPGPAQASTMQV